MSLDRKAARARCDALDALGIGSSSTAADEAWSDFYNKAHEDLPAALDLLDRAEEALQEMHHNTQCSTCLEWGECDVTRLLQDLSGPTAG